MNGGVCTDAVAAYNCTCTEGFVGTYFNHCYIHLITCIFIAVYSVAIFTGINCEQKYSECANQPCLNNGTCLDYDGFICQCPDGYSGKRLTSNR